MNAPFFVLAGNLVRFFLTFADENGTLTDPTSVTCEVGMTDVDATSLSPVHDSTGKYHADWDTTAAVAGIYYLKANGTGALLVAGEVPIRIRIPHI